MQIVASTCKVGGEQVAIVAVEKGVLEGGSEADRYIMHLKTAFPDAEVVLYADDGGKARYYGRGDLVDALGEVPVDEIPWQQMDVDL